MTYTLRLATEGDYGWLEILRREAYLDLFIATWGGWDEERHRRHFAAFLDKGSIAIIEAEGADIGVLQVIELADRVEVKEIQILPRYQRQGLGSAILKDTIGQARARSKDVYLSLGLHNTRAYQLYARLGFREYDRSETHIYMKILA